MQLEIIMNLQHARNQAEIGKGPSSADAPKNIVNLDGEEHVCEILQRYPDGDVRVRACGQQYVVAAEQVWEA